MKKRSNFYQNMKQIRLGGNRYKNKPVRAYALIDDEDFLRISQFAWHLSTSGYAVRNQYPKRGHVRMTWEIMGKKGLFDHKDRNRLNNQKGNLRLADKSKNAMNVSLRSTNTSGFKGVHFDKITKRWRVEIRHTNRRIRLGRFSDIREAALAYNKTAQELFGEFAYLNSI